MKDLVRHYKTKLKNFSLEKGYKNEVLTSFIITDIDNVGITFKNIKGIYYISVGFGLFGSKLDDELRRKIIINFYDMLLAIIRKNNVFFKGDTHYSIATRDAKAMKNISSEIKKALADIKKQVA